MFKAAKSNPENLFSLSSNKWLVTSVVMNWSKVSIDTVVRPLMISSNIPGW